MLYALVDPRRPDEIRYVGTAVDPERRFRNHRWNINRSKFPLYVWWRELRGEGRSPQMIVLGFGGCEEERHAIARLREAGVPLLNVHGRGGTGHLGHKHTPETRARISAACRGKNLGNTFGVGRSPSPETRAKLAAAGRGRTHSIETRAKLRAINSGTTAKCYRACLTDDHRAKVSASLRVNSVERGARISAAHKRKSEEEKLALRAKISASMVGRPNVGRPRIRAEDLL